MAAPEPITMLLDAVASGQAEAADRLLERVYDELHRLAAQMLARETPGSSVQATILVHDAWLALYGEGDAAFERRAHFFGAAAQAMRRMLVDHARRRRSEKRGGHLVRVTLADLAGEGAMADAAVLGLHDAVEALERVAPDVAKVVELRYFAGLTVEETAAAVGRSTATVKREWAYARVFLHDHMQRAEAEA